MPDYVFGLCELLHITPFAFSSVGQKRDRGAQIPQHFLPTAGRLMLGWIKSGAVMTGDAVESSRRSIFLSAVRPNFYFARV